jgi:hypothetical protein
MPTQETVQILLPRAADLGRGTISTREYRMQLFARRDNAYKQVNLEQIDYSPAWAKIEATIYEGDREMARLAGANGTIEIEAEITDMEAETIAVENLSIDTEVRVNLRFRGWQVGEG